MKLKVLIIEPTEIVAAGLMAVLREQSRFRLLEPLHNLDDADVQMSMSTPDVVVINPTMDGWPPTTPSAASWRWPTSLCRKACWNSLAGWWM